MGYYKDLGTSKVAYQCHITDYPMSEDKHCFSYNFRDGSLQPWLIHKITKDTISLTMTLSYTTKRILMDISTMLVDQVMTSIALISKPLKQVLKASSSY